MSNNLDPNCLSINSLGLFSTLVAILSKYLWCVWVKGQGQQTTKKHAQFTIMLGLVGLICFFFFSNLYMALMAADGAPD